MGHALPEARAVRQPGQRVVRGGVLEVVDQAAVLDRRRREGRDAVQALEQPGVEREALRAVRHGRGQDAEELVAGDDRHHDEREDAERVQQALQEGVVDLPGREGEGARVLPHRRDRDRVAGAQRAGAQQRCAAGRHARRRRGPQRLVLLVPQPDARAVESTIAGIASASRSATSWLLPPRARSCARATAAR